MTKRGLIPSLITFTIIASWLLVMSCKKGIETSVSTVVTPVDSITGDNVPFEINPQIYLALGDSYTIGQSVDSLDRFPAQTAALLVKNGIHISRIQYVAATGWTTVNLLSAILSQNLQGPFAAVSVLIGVNDQYKSRDTTGYRQSFIRVLNEALQLSGNRKDRVFVLSIPDYGVTPFGGNDPKISLQIDQFNDINREVTMSYDISYTDITEISRNDAGNNSMITFDGLHPSGKQYAQWAEKLEPEMYKALR